MNPRILALVLLATMATLACRRRHHAYRPAALPAHRTVVEPAEVPEERPAATDELLPGDATAYGLVMPLGTHLRLETPAAKMFYVDASMNRVMRYLQRRLEFHDADIHPLGAMIHNAHIAVDAGIEPLVDVGVRDEGDRTLVTIWNHTPPPPSAPRSLEDGLRAAGIDPTTGRPLPQFNN